MAARLESQDPAERYAVDLVLGSRPDERSRTLLACYVATSQRIHQMSQGEFYAHYGEALRGLDLLEMPTAQAADAVYGMHKRHAQAVRRVVSDSIGAHAEALADDALPQYSLVRLVVNSNPVTEHSATLSRQPPSEPDNYLWQAGRAWPYRFNGGKRLYLLDSVGVHYLHRLLSQPGVPISVSDLYKVGHTHEQRYQLIDLPDQHQSHGQVPQWFDAHQIPDRETMRQLLRRQSELRAHIDQARAESDENGERAAQSELERIEREIRRTLTGRPQESTTQIRDKMRRAIGQALTRVVDTIAGDDPAFGLHLQQHGVLIKSGYNPCYNPPTAIVWVTERPAVDA